MTTERQGSYDETGGVDAIVATREDQLTGGGLDDTERASTGSDTAGGYGASMGTPSTSGTTSGGDRLGDTVGSVAGRAADTAQRAVDTQVDTATTRAGDMLSQVAQAVRSSGEQLRDQQPQVASLADTAASQVERFAGHLRETDLQRLMTEAEDFARRQPALFLGGAFALGLVASRFLKASPQGGGGSSGYGFRGGSGYRGDGYRGSYGAGGGGRYAYGDRYTQGGYDTGYAAGSGYGGTGYPSTTGYGRSGTTTGGTTTAGSASGTSETGVEHGGA
jgi:hypothetical protein